MKCLFCGCQPFTDLIQIPLATQSRKVALKDPSENVWQPRHPRIGTSVCISHLVPKFLVGRTNRVLLPTVLNLMRFRWERSDPVACRLASFFSFVLIAHCFMK